MFDDTPWRTAAESQPRTRTTPTRASVVRTPIRALPRQRTTPAELPPTTLTPAAATVPLLVERTADGVRLTSPALPRWTVGVPRHDHTGIGRLVLAALTEADIAGYSARRSGAYTSRPRTPAPTAAAALVAAPRWRTSHDPRDWTPPGPDEPRWRAPGGSYYRESTLQVQRTRARRAALGITDPPPRDQPGEAATP